MTTGRGREQKARREIVPVCWCWPGSRFGGYVWGTLLVGAGAVWLMANVGVVTMATLETFWPLALIALGVAHLLRAGRGRFEWPGR